MANDSHHFPNGRCLARDGYRLEGNVWSSPFDRYLPMYEAKMLQQFDHRFSTYQGATEKQLNVGRSPDSRTPPISVIRRSLSSPAIGLERNLLTGHPELPRAIGHCLRVEHRASVQRILCYWAAGHYLNHGNDTAAHELLKIVIH